MTSSITSANEIGFSPATGKMSSIWDYGKRLEQRGIEKHSFSINKFFSTVWLKIKTYVDRYPIIFAALVIYLYYLATSLNLFEHHSEKKDFADYFFQFDSLFFMWLAALAFMQVRKERKIRADAELQRRELEYSMEKQVLVQKFADEMVALLQDRVSNPLATISLVSQKMRRKFEKDIEIHQWLDLINSAVTHLRDFTVELQAYEAQRIISETTIARHDAELVHH